MKRGRTPGPWLRMAALLFAGLLAVMGQAEAQGRMDSFERGSLAIETAAGARHDFQVELAVTPAQQAQGLMHRRSLAADAGMLFLYLRVRPVSMWMKNTLIPLDMLFLAPDGQIVRIVERTVPESLEVISSGAPVAGVLELNGGTTARLRIAVGDRVRHPAFGGGS